MTKYFWRFFFIALFLFSGMFVLFDYGPIIRIPILQYERIQSGGVQGSGWLSPKDLVHHINYIHNHNIKVVPLSDVVKWYKTKKKLPPKTIALTFDGSHDYLMDVVFNNLYKHKMPATFFITSSLIGKPGYLSEEDLKKISESEFITIASHGKKDNIDLSKMNAQDVYSQAYFSKTDIKNYTRNEVHYFSYPKGKYNHQAAQKVKEVGYKAAFASYLGRTKWKREKGLFHIERTPIYDTEKRLLLLRLKCWGNFSVLKAWYEKYVGKYF